MADTGLAIVAVIKLKRSMRPLIKIGFSFVAVIVLVSIFAGKSFVLDLMRRHGSALVFTGLVDIKRTSSSFMDYTDSGHVRQSLVVTKYFLANSRDFWGGGLNRRNENYMFIEGQSSGGVHSSFASIWQFFGLPGVVYYIFLVIIVLRVLYDSLRNNLLGSFENYFCLTLAIYFVARFITGWFAGDYFFMYLQLGLQYVLLFPIFKVYRQYILNGKAYWPRT